METRTEQPTEQIPANNTAATATATPTVSAAPQAPTAATQRTAMPAQDSGSSRPERPLWLLPVAIAATLIAGLAIGGIAGGFIGYSMGSSTQTQFGGPGQGFGGGGMPGAPEGQSQETVPNS